VAVVRTNTSEERIASVIRVKRINELATTLALPHGVTFQNTSFFIITAMKTSNLTSLESIVDLC
jgi:hypothetical protein